MKLIIAGSRFKNKFDIDIPPFSSEKFRMLSAFCQALVYDAMTASPWKWGEVTEVVSGTAIGIDRAGEAWAEVYGIPVKHFPARWNKYGKGAGMVRNQQMGSYADALLAIWDGESKGTKHMIEWMQRLKKPVFVFIPEEFRR